ncbi:MAG TPA: zinc ribbon domain-containing protein [Oligoflexia bacterium]|nr:zinc ribbon domain-containing protein [Oligoflexia bacterium]HMP26719.1 zinc ribbon domain-containing protein [Oligoflexia bacterium]
MPLYEFECPKCGVIEILQRVGERQPKICPECRTKGIKKLISEAAFHLKGSGWYKTDYSGSASKNGVSNGVDSGSATVASAQGCDRSQTSDSKKGTAVASSSHGCKTGCGCSK